MQNAAEKSGCVSRIGVSWLVADTHERLAAMMLGGVRVNLHDREWLDLDAGQRAAIVDAANHCPLLRLLAGDDAPVAELAAAWASATTSARMATLLLGKVQVDLFERPWTDLMQIHRKAIATGARTSPLLRVLRAVNYDLFEPDLPIPQHELNLAPVAPGVSA